MKDLERELSQLENEAFEIEVDYRVENLYTDEEFLDLMDEYNRRINILMFQVYPTRFLELPENCPCRRVHVKDSFFLNSHQPEQTLDCN